MSAVRLGAKYIAKPWGREDIRPFANPSRERVGEIWFDGPVEARPPLLVKYIFTNENLSIQVHPTDAEAQAVGLPGGKSECWYVLDAEPGATLGIGTKRPLDREALRASALDGTLASLIDWKPVQAGSLFYIPAGTVHAIGGGVTLVEVQTNNDVTYRLFDYGRPRELHLDAGVAVSRAQPYSLPERVVPTGQNCTLLDQSQDAPFTLSMRYLEEGETLLLECEQSWFIPLTGSGTVGQSTWQAQQCWLIEGTAEFIAKSGTTALIATV